MTVRRFVVLVGVLFLLLARPLVAQDPALLDVELEDVDLSYIYPVVMGTGVYKIDGRRLSMITMPFSVTQQRLGEDGSDVGVKWFLSVTLGYDEVEDYEWLDQLVDANLVTVSAMPGVEVSIPLDNTWTLRPFAQLGLGRDFVADENFALGSFGTRLMGLWNFEERWELRFGTSARLAGEAQFNSGRQNSFALIEVGVDLRRDTQLTMAQRKLNFGTYYRLQNYYPEWSVGKVFKNRSEINDVQEIGVSAGLRRPVKVLGFTLSRVRLGYQRGSGFKGWSFGTDFPF